MRILITGATGLIGSEIVKLCKEKEIGVNYLTTSKSKIEKQSGYKGFHWNPSKGEIDPACLEEVGAVINLAGANIFRRWTDNAKEKILKSRIDSLDLLYRTLENNEHEVGHLVSASAIGVYPHSYDKMYSEDEKDLDDHFLGTVVQKWEAAADRFRSLDLRVAKIRVGLVLGKDGGALPKLNQVVKMNVGAVLGKGKQWQSWIHVRDLARIFLHVVENGFQGVYNAVAPNPVTHQELMNELAKQQDKKIWLPKVPSFVLKGIMGEMASTVLASQLVASKKIEDTGYAFQYVNIHKALENLK
ncbi:NAD-dependent epimerase [Salinimicrobium marinum]|uniref:NAD-dependent epimerase n=1 Tax=Salinimicrobium marinum TaxID=680283 RepID=A0A918S7E7_9FLAO|nr:TIGR01777 family oxidoreductase [Salinimicrobium marinum]GHA28312.1 NAD-dependent epimerase [Salinimicrobium marinum]